MPIPSSINDLSTTAGSNSPPGSESPSLIDDYLRTYASYIALLRDGAQSNSFNFAAASGSSNAITATYSPAITVLSDSTVLLVKAAATNTGATTFSPNGMTAKPIVGLAHTPLQGGEIVANGELCLQYNSSVGGGSWVLIYSTGAAVPTLHGQCRLGVVSPTSIGLFQYGGSGLVINSVVCKVPSSPPLLSNSGTLPNTFYYIYAYMNAGVMTLEASATAHATDAGGIEIKSGDPTRTLVGAVYMNPSNQFVRSQSFLGVISWFNRQNLALAQGATTTAFTSGTMTETTLSGRIFFINWQDEGVVVSLAGTMNLSAIATVQFNIYVNGTINKMPNGGASGSAGQNINCGHPGNISAVEGVFNYTTMFASTTGGTVTAAFTNFLNMRG